MRNISIDMPKNVFVDKGEELLGEALKWAEVDVYSGEYGDESQELYIVEDDGCLHISCDGVRYAIYIGQDVSMRDYKAEAKRALRALCINGYEVQGS